jgi:predicted aspartyl protease
MQIRFENGLLLTSLMITYKGKTKIVNNIIIDTGAAHSMLSSDTVEDIGIRFTNGDRIISMYGIGGEDYAFEKVVENIKIGDINIEGYDMHFGLINSSGINGLLGLDLLMKAGMIIDLKNLKVYKGD